MTGEQTQSHISLLHSHIDLNWVECEIPPPLQQCNLLRPQGAY